jgi:hypothetical protein
LVIGLWVQKHIARFVVEWISFFWRTLPTAWIRLKLLPQKRIYRFSASEAFVKASGAGAVQMPHNRSYAVSVWLGYNADYAGVVWKFSSVRRPTATSSFIEENQISIDNGAMGFNRLGVGGVRNLVANRHRSAGNLAFMDSHSETFRWRGARLKELNSQSSANDSATQRPNAGAHPVNGAPWDPNFPDYIRLAQSAPDL